MLIQQAVSTELWFPVVKSVEKERYNIYLQCTRREACDNVTFCLAFFLHNCFCIC